jgi:xanthine/CO dehydrogenase XdhC/CoxF family maturation factor
LNSAALVRFFDARRQRGEPMVLVTVYETQGSTYSKSGAQMLIASDGRFQGMLSGGCLEGDLVLRAAAVIDSGIPQVVTYDLAQDDELWGLGVGCDGLMRVFLQPLGEDNGYQPFADVAEAMQGSMQGWLAVVIDSEAGAARIGATALSLQGDVMAFGMSAPAAERLFRQQTAGQSGLVSADFDGATATVLFALVKPPPRLLVLGAGMDAEPVVRLAAEMGWRCTVVDHRDAHVERGDFAGAEEVLCRQADLLAEELDLSRFNAAIVMSHHLASDRCYLRQLASTDITYIGLLGPASRRSRLLADLGDDAAHLTERLHGPAGLDIGGRGPAAIALSIIAVVQGVLAGETG